MTITVTIEELRDFESKCREWWKQRALAFEKIVPVQRDSFMMGEFRQETVQRVSDAMKKWDAEHPMPTLIPRV